MKSLHLCVVALAAVSLPVHALEAVAMPAQAAAGCPSENALQQKVASLTQIIKSLEDQLAKCAQGQGVTCPAVTNEKPAAPEVSVNEPVAPQATNLPAPAPAYVPSNRYGGGFRMAPEPRLTCEDYSESYFHRHPTMARVCGRGEALISSTLPDEQVPAAVSVTSPLPESVVSATAL